MGEALVGIVFVRHIALGGAIVTILGCLFLLQQLWDVTFRHTWPVLLIAVGLMQVTGVWTALVGQLQALISNWQTPL